MLYSQNIDILSKVIMDDAYREAESIIEKAQKEAESIIENGLKDSNIMFYKDKNKFSKVLLYNNKEKTLSLEEFHARSDILARKESIIKEILQHIQQEFYNLPDTQGYLDILKKLIVQALGYLNADGRRFLCRVNERDKSLLDLEFLQEVEKRTNKELSVDNAPADIVGGVIVIRSDQRVLYDNSLEAIFERNRQTIRCMAAELIFGK